MDYEQKYYDLLYENKKLKKKIEELEGELSLVNKSTKEKLNIKKEIIRELDIYYKNIREKNKKNVRNTTNS